MTQLKNSILLCFIAPWAIMGILSHVTGEDFKLSPEGMARKDAHEFLFGEFAQGRALEFTGSGSARKLDEIRLSNDRIEVSGELRVKLPEGSQRVASMFRYIVLKGEGLDRLEGLVFAPYSNDASLEVSTKQPGIYRAKVPAMPVPSDSMPTIEIRSRCKAGETVTITEIAFNSQGKLSPTFDDLPYRNLGEEFPRQPVIINVDVTRELSLDGHVDLEREKFCRYYAAPGGVHESFERWAAERNFLPGRQMFKFQPALVDRGWSRGPRLTESESKPGAADLSFFDRHDSSGSVNKSIPQFRDIRYAMCLNDYPEFMSVKTVGRGTPLIEHFDDAAELAAAYIADQIRDGGRTATYWEVKNECTIKSEWDYHWNDRHDAWKLMADFHNKVADAVHARSPEVKVGGPSSAWMQVQVNDFDLYRSQTRFMDLTKDHLDFYSHHFYEDTGSLGAWHRRGSTYSNYLLGRLEAILDMFVAYMHQTDNVKPILITECGSLQPGRGPSDYWLRIRTFSGYMHKFMQRPQQIDLAVPFVFLSIPWDPTSGDAAFTPKPGKPNSGPMKNFEATPLAHFYDLWRDFDGRRLPISFDQPFLDATAVYRDNRFQIALTNMGGKRLSVSLAGTLVNLDTASVSQRRLYYRDGKIIYEDAVSLPNISEIPVDVEETTIVSIQLKRPLKPQSKLSCTSWHTAGTAVKSTVASATGFQIRTKFDQPPESATLVVGLYRDGGLGGPLAGTINGQPFELAADWADEMQYLFAPLRASVPVHQLRQTNEIKLASREGLTITSVRLETLAGE